PYQSEYDRLKPLDLDEETHYWFIEECGRAGIKPLTTVFTRSAIEFVARCGWDEVKVASYDCASYPMLSELRRRFQHVYVSTGAMYDHEIEGAAEVLAGGDFTFLHCVTIYPTPLDQMHLARMEYLRRFTDSIGFSDHSLVARDGIKAAAAALANGAQVIERHFTVLPADATKDGPVSITPPMLRELVELARLPQKEIASYVASAVPEAEAMMGFRHRELSHAELLNRDYYRGRFASRNGNGYIFNWEDRPLS
ncbi:MAG TPA: N-acetylneuraminate synthase family protein, partial [Blastocatellia bacterium]|nr:N-acetylneuraminate synthase family protein [Blastocatellia bacterium]